MVVSAASALTVNGVNPDAMTLTGGKWSKDSPVRPARDVLRSVYLGFSLEPMLHIVSGNASTRGKQIEGPLSYPT
jgi:hypothetical protein